MSGNTKNVHAINKQSSNILIFNFKTFNIPNDFPFFNDINPDICKILRTNHKYKVKSIVSDDVFISFINYWIKRKIPNFCIENIKEYEILSQEFDYMKDFIKMFQQFTLKTNNSSKKSKNKLLNQLRTIKQNSFDRKSKNYRQTIEYLFTNNTNNSCFMFVDNKKELLEAAENSKLVNCLTSKSVILNGLSYVLNEKEMTASVFRNLTASGDILIPTSINYESKRFIVTSIFDEAFSFSKIIKSVQFQEDSELKSICKRAFENSSLETISIPKSATRIEELAFSCCNLKKIQFHKDSNLKSIKKRVFSWSKIETIIIPSSIKEMKVGWCSEVLNLKNITINQSNENYFSYLDDSCIIGKSDIESNEFDTLIFARRNIEKVTIPSFIKAISPYAFEYCSRLQKVTFLENSKLQLIDKNSFTRSSIESITIPSHIHQIGKFAFFSCNKLKSVYFSENSELNLIDMLAFSKSSIEKIEIPSQVYRIGESSFSECNKLVNVTFSENSELRIIDKSAFTMSAIKDIVIPRKTTKIGDLSFCCCYHLKKVEFPEDSELKSIGCYAFSKSPIESIDIPSKVVEINEGWCGDASNLKIINVSPKNKIFTFLNSFLVRKTDPNKSVYDSLVVAPRNIKRVSIPPFIKWIESYAFQFCRQIQTFEFSDQSELVSIGNNAFSVSSLQKFSLPSKVTRIGEFAFSECDKLSKFNISEESNLMIIDQNAFSFSVIQSFYIPSQVHQILDYAFSECKRLQIIEISDNSKLYLIKDDILLGSSIKIITIPPKNNYLNKSILKLSI